MKNTPLTIAGTTIEPGQHVTITLSAARLYTYTPVDIPVHVYHGKQAGPRLFIISAIHGDEINGVEIVRRLQNHHVLKRIKGTLIMIPIANVYGFILQSRYLPDNRDLNRSFPGSKKGSLAARLANLLMEEIVQKCTHGIDLHTGALKRTNLPQIRVNLDTPGALDLARAFNVPVILDAKLRDGSLREAAAELGMPLLIYEAGETLRFEEIAVRVGVKGIINVMRTLDMIPHTKPHKKVSISRIAYTSTWLRAPTSGIVHLYKDLGAYVEKDEVLGIIADPFGSAETDIKLPDDEAGIVIGKNNLPLVNEGDALLHIARFKNPQKVAARVHEFRTEVMKKIPAIKKTNDDLSKE